MSARTKRSLTLLALLLLTPLLACDSRSGITAIVSPNTPSLSNIQLSDGTLSPPFDPATTVYAATVPNATASIIVTPSTGRANTVLRVNGVEVANGAPSAAIPLTVGTNTITVQVANASGVGSRSYTVNVRRT